MGCIFSGRVTWIFSDSERIKIGSAWVDWVKIYSAISHYIKDYENTLTQHEAVQLGRKLLIDPELRGSFIFWLENGYQIGEWWNPDTEVDEKKLEAIIKAVLRKAKEKILYSASAVKTNGEKTYFSFLNTNYSQIVESRYEVFDLYEIKENFEKSSHTFINIDCIQGEINTPIRWVEDEVRCGSEI